MSLERSLLPQQFTQPRHRSSRYQLALTDETITLQFETSERVETPSSLTINESMITVS